MPEELWSKLVRTSRKNLIVKTKGLPREAPFMWF